MKNIFLGFIFFLISQFSFATQKPFIPSQATTCIQANFTNSGNQYWKTIYLTLTNQCGQAVDFQNTTVTFLNTSNLNTAFWGNFNPLSYPDNNLQISSQQQTPGNFLSTLFLHFPTYVGSNSILPNNSSITLIYGAASADYVNGTVNVYLGSPVNTGEIDLSNTSAQPANVAQPYAIIHINFNGQPLTSVQVPWMNTLKINNLSPGTYTLSPESVTDSSGNMYQGTANPESIALTSGAILSSKITYSMIASNGSISFAVPALPSELSGYTNQPVVTLKNNSNGSATNATVNWNATTPVSKLVNGATYTFTTPSITYNGYQCAPTFNPTSAVAGTTAPRVNLTYACTQIVTSGGRIIGYLPGWKTPPSATELATAGYTHILVAFGVFNTTTPGQITPAFDTVSASYIKSLQNLGIKVLLSLGGASTSIPNTTINFHEVLSKASSPSAFTQTFIQSLESLITQYGFDGFDIDIESGLTAGGTFSQPQGDIAVLANIINTMHANHPSLLLTLVPQTANIAVTRDFSDIWGNYASLVMQTYNSLEWVGIQNYNTGCMLGIDSVCYDANNTSSPDFSVAMATDLLANWPAPYQPYITHLRPSQVVLGYLAPNAQGTGDGNPVIPVSTIKRAIQCLRTGIKGANSCGTYVPPKTYPGIGGVFDWEVTYDQNNKYQFATGLKACVIQGTC